MSYLSKKIKEFQEKKGIRSISLATLQNWEQGRRPCYEPLVELVEYKLKKEKLI